MSSIRELAEKAAKGDGAAFDELYERTKSGVWFTCKSLLKNEENAKDIMQDTYLAAFENLGSLTDFGGIQSWLNRIAANKCKNYIKSKSNSAIAEDSEELLENIPDDNLLPEEYVTDMAKRRIIMDIIERSLSEDQYRTIILYYFDEMTAAEIAALMECHEKTVLYRLKTARSKIKEEVMRYEEKNQDKLHAVVFVPLLTQLLRLEAENTPVPNVPIKFQAPPSTQNNVPSNAAASAAKQGGKTMLNTLKAKVIAGACAAVVVGGGVTAGILISNNSKNNATSTPAVSTPANVSKPTNASAPANATSKPANVSKPAGQSTPDATDKTNDPEFKGLTAVDLKRKAGSEILPDIASGNIKEMRFSDKQGYLFLMNDGEIVYYCFNEGTEPFTVSFGKDTGIDSLEKCFFQDYVTTFTLLVIDNNNILFKVLDENGEVCLSNKENPRQITGTLKLGDDVVDIAVSRFGEIFAFDAEGLGFEIKTMYSQYYELAPNNLTISVHDDNRVFYYPPETKGEYFLGMKVKKFAGSHFITDEGKVYKCDGAGMGMISDEDPIEYLMNYNFVGLYHDSSSNEYNLGLYSGVTDDDKIVTFNTTTSKILFAGDKPEGNIQNIWQSVQRVVVKTDRGIFAADYNNDTVFKPIEALNGIDKEVVYLNGRYVLLDNGCLYTIDEYKW